MGQCFAHQRGTRNPASEGGQEWGGVIQAEETGSEWDRLPILTLLLQVFLFILEEFGNGTKIMKDQ